jgi:hypothetical protein
VLKFPILLLVRIGSIRGVVIIAFRISLLLMTNGLANSLLFEPNGRHRIAASPKLFTIEMAFSPANLSCYGNRTFPCEIADHFSESILGRNLDEPMPMIGEQMSFKNLTVFLSRSFLKYGTKKFPNLSVSFFLATFRNTHQMILAIPFGMT